MSISMHHLNSPALTKCLVIAMVAYRSIYLVKSKSFTRGDNSARKSQKNFHGLILRIIVSLDDQFRLTAEGGHPHLPHHVLVGQVPVCRVI